MNSKDCEDLQKTLKKLELPATTVEWRGRQLILLNVEGILRGMKEAIRIVPLHEDERVDGEEKVNSLIIKELGLADTTPALILHQAPSEPMTFGAYPFCSHGFSSFIRALHKGGKKFLRNFILSNYPILILNPYDSKKAVSEKMFFVRSDDISDLVSEKENYVVYGPRRGGKTSLALAVERCLRVNSELGITFKTGLGTEKYLHSVVYVDVQSLALSEDLWMTILKKMGLEARDLIRGGLWKKLHLPRREFVNKSPFEILFTLLENKYQRSVIMLDEIDDFLEADSKQGFPYLSKLRVLTDSPKANAKIILFGYHKLYSISKKHSFPLHGRFERKRIANLNYDALRKLIKEPMEEIAFKLIEEPQIVSRIKLATGGMPNLVQDFCRRLINELDRKNETVISPRFVMDFIDKNRDSIINQVYQGFNALEDSLPRLIAHLAIGLDQIRLLDMLEILESRYRICVTDQHVRTALDYLFLHNILHMTDEPDEYVFASDILQDRLKRDISSKKGRILVDSIVRQAKKEYGIIS